MRNRLKNAYHIHNHHQTKTEATEEENNEKMHRFSRIKCDIDTENKKKEKKRPV